MLSEYGVHQISSPAHPQEDRYRILNQSVPIVTDEHGHLYMVSDGVGGAEQGMQTAQKIADNLIKYYLEATYSPGPDSVISLLNETNAECHEWGYMENTNRTKAGAAVSILQLTSKGKAFVFHVGDTAVYHISDKREYCVTSTHSTDGGLINYIGVGETFHIEYKVITFEEGDIFVMVSDGVTKVLRDDEIMGLSNEYYPPQKAAKELVERSRRLGSRDDITAIVVEIEDIY